MEEVPAPAAEAAAKVALVREGHARFNRGDIEGCLELLADDIDWHPAFGEALIGASEYHGREGFRRYFEQVQEVIDGFAVVPREIAVAGDHVVLESEVSGRGRASGMEISTGLTIVWRVRGSLLAWGATYFNRSDALKAIGLAEEELQPAS